MKIIIPNLPIPWLRYIAQCLECTKDQAINTLMWDVNNKSIIDMFDEIRPDIIFIHTSQLDSAFEVICKDFNFKYVLITENQIPTNLTQSPNAIIDISNNAPNPNASDVLHAKPMVNIPDIHNAQYIDKIKSQILINTTFATLDNDVMGLLYYLTDHYSVKIIGEQRIPLHHYLGKVDIIERANLFKSTQIVIDIGNHNDCWDAAYLQVPSMSIHPTNNIIFYCKNLSFLKMHLGTLLNKELVRKKYIAECYKEAYDNTSFHFSSQLFNIIGEFQLSQALLNTLEDLR